MTEYLIQALLFCVKLAVPGIVKLPEVALKTDCLTALYCHACQPFLGTSPVNDILAVPLPPAGMHHPGIASYTSCALAYWRYPLHIE